MAKICVIISFMNDIYSIINSIWLPIILGVLCMGYGIYLAVTGDPTAIRRKDKNPLLKDKDCYVKNAMWLFFFMALGCFIMVLIIQFLNNDTAATIESITWFIVFAILWKRNEDKNGAL